MVRTLCVICIDSVFAVLFGSDAVQRILEMIPDVIMNGLTVAGKYASCSWYGNASADALG